jgi:hypothetical protein
MSITDRIYNYLNMEHLKRRETFEQLSNKDAASLLRQGHLDGQSLDTAHQRPELHDLSLPCAEHVIRIQNKPRAMPAEIITLANTRKREEKYYIKYGVMQHEWADAHPKTSKHLQLGRENDLQEDTAVRQIDPHQFFQVWSVLNDDPLKFLKSPYRRTRLLDRRYTISTPTTFLSFTHSRAVQFDSIACRECCDMVTFDKSSVLRTGSCGGRSVSGNLQQYTFRASRKARLRRDPGRSGLGIA